MEVKIDLVDKYDSALGQRVRDYPGKALKSRHVRSTSQRKHGLVTDTQLSKWYHAGRGFHSARRTDPGLARIAWPTNLDICGGGGQLATYDATAVIIISNRRFSSPRSGVLWPPRSPTSLRGPRHRIDPSNLQTATSWQRRAWTSARLWVPNVATGSITNDQGPPECGRCSIVEKLTE